MALPGGGQVQRAAAAVLLEVPLPPADAVQPHADGRAGPAGRLEEAGLRRPLWWLADGQAVFAGERLGMRGADPACGVSGLRMIWSVIVSVIVQPSVRAIAAA